MLKVVVLGSGNVAQHLIKVFSALPAVTLIQAYARTPEKLAHLLPADSITASLKEIKPADIYIISVTDGAVAEVSSALPFSNRLIAHTSGSVALEQLDAKNRRAVFYPLQTFSKNKDVDFKNIPLCLESENTEDYKILETLAKSVSDKVYTINSIQRQSLHVSAVFVSNFVNHMYTIGYNLCRENNVPFDVLKPLIAETADKIQQLPPQEAQTGPAIRNDIKTMEKHMASLKNETYKLIYKTLSQSIQENGKKL
jgi:predicted short-subunit dehydrogenase-like oxidoreductase (DUF2520 family)